MALCVCLGLRVLGPCVSGVRVGTVCSWAGCAYWPKSFFFWPSPGIFSLTRGGSYRGKTPQPEPLGTTMALREDAWESQKSRIWRPSSGPLPPLHRPRAWAVMCVLGVLGLNSLRVRGLFVCVRTRVLCRGGDSLCVTGQSADAECLLSSPIYLAQRHQGGRSGRRRTCFCETRPRTHTCPHPCSVQRGW